MSKNNFKKGKIFDTWTYNPYLFFISVGLLFYETYLLRNSPLEYFIFALFYFSFAWSIILSKKKKIKQIEGEKK